MFKIKLNLIKKKAIEILDFQIKKLYEDKLKGLINEKDFSRMYEKKVNERDNKTKKLEELNISYIVITPFQKTITNIFSLARTKERL